MNAEQFEIEKLISFVIAGLNEKSETKTDSIYPYSEKLFAGMNLFAAQSMLFSERPEEVLKDMHEAAFITKYAAKPVHTWFSTWTPDITEKIKNNREDLWNTGALVHLIGDGNTKYVITQECDEIAQTLEPDLLSSLEQRSVYNDLKQLSQEDYVYLRKFLIENPISSNERLSEVKVEYSDNETACNVITNTYEQVPHGCYICSYCGWTISYYGKLNQAYCCSNDCLEHTQPKTNAERIPPKNNNRLKRGVMRYISLPGRLELEIAELKKKYKHIKNIELWPNMDEYDIGITFSDNSYWAIDAKTNKNPYSLKRIIGNDLIPQRVKCERFYYVVPDARKREHPDYCHICNEALTGQTANKHVRCITLSELKREIQSRGSV